MEEKEVRGSNPQTVEVSLSKGRDQVICYRNL